MPLIWLWHWLMKILLEPFLYIAIIWDKSGRRGFDYFPWNAVMFRQIFGYFKRWGFDFGSVGSASKPSRIGRHIITIWGCTPKGSTVGAIMKRDVFYLLWQRVHKHHSWVNINGTPDHLFPTPQNYSLYSPEEIEKPLATYTSTLRMLLSSLSRTVTTFRPIAPKLSSFQISTVVYTVPISALVLVTPRHSATVSAPITASISVTPKQTSPAAASRLLPLDKMPPEIKADKKPRKLVKDQDTIMVAQCQEKSNSATETESASKSPASVSTVVKSPPVQNADGHVTPTSDWDVVEDEIQLLKPLMISLETYRQKRALEDETDIQNPEATETDTSSTSATSGIKPNQSWFDSQQGVQQISWGLRNRRVQRK